MSFPKFTSKSNSLGSCKSLWVPMPGILTSVGLVWPIPDTIWVSVNEDFNFFDTNRVRVFDGISGLGICGTQVFSSIQDIVDEVPPIKKKAPLWG